MRKTARTYSNQLALMEEYPEYAFLLCEPPILEWLKELYPNVYDRVLEKVRSGEVQFCPHGRPVALEITHHSLDHQFDRMGF